MGCSGSMEKTAQMITAERDEQLYKDGGKRLEISRPAVLLAHNRSGGTLLAHCLDGHYAIECIRDEALHQLSAFRQIFNASNAQIMQFATSRPMVDVSMLKISHKHFMQMEGVREYIFERGIPVIYLRRDNLLLAAISEMARKGKARPTHAYYNQPKEISVAIRPHKLIDYCWVLRREVMDVSRALEGHDPVLRLSYTDLVGWEGNEVEWIQEGAANLICDFLGVPRRVLRASNMKKVSHSPAQMISNWDDVKSGIIGTKFEQFLGEAEQDLSK